MVRINRLAAGLLGLATLGCSSGGVLRRPIPEQFVDKVEIPGVPEARCTRSSASNELVRQNLVAAFAADLAEGGRQRERIYHVLCMSGGGDGGAFGAGFLNGWTQHGDRPEFKIVTGVSTGALLAPLAFLGSDYDARMKTLYTTINSESILNPRWLIQLLSADSVASSEPLRNLIAETVTPQLLQLVAAEHKKGRRLYVGSTNLDAGRFTIWDLGAIACSSSPRARDLFIDAMLASSSIPAVFPPVYVQVEAGGQQYTEMHVDGGVQANAFFPDLFFDELTLREEQGLREASLMTSVIRDAGLDNEQVSWRIYYLRNGELDIDHTTVRPRLQPIAGRSISTLIQVVNFSDALRFAIRGGLARTEVFLAGLPASYQRPDAVGEFDTKEMQRMYGIGEQLALDEQAWIPFNVKTLFSRETFDSTDNRAD